VLLLTTAGVRAIPSSTLRGLAASAGFAVAIGVATLPYARFRYWRRWWRPWWLGLTCHLLVNAGAGAVGWLLARYLAWDPVHSFWLNAFAYGAAGQALLRVDTTDFGFGAVQPVSSLLTRVTQWLSAMLDSGAKSRIAAYLDMLSDDDLRLTTYRIYFSQVQHSPTIPADVKAALLAAIEEADQIVSKGDIPAGRERLRGVCLKWISDHALVDLPSQPAEERRDSPPPRR
jgi:hypothetical protein